MILGTAAFNAKIKEVSDLYQAEKPRLALDRLRRMVDRGVFTPEEQWQVYNCYSNCYYRLFDLDRQLEYLWLSINTTLGQSLREQQTALSDYLMLIHYSDKFTDELMRSRHFCYDELTRTTETFAHEPTRHRHRRIRIGYLADTFAENVSSYFTLQFFTDYDPSRFEIYCYGLRPWAEDAILPKLIGERVQKIVSIPRSATPKEIADLIYADEIDILFDLEVHNAGGKTVMVASHKPAPVQIAGIGFMNTSGLRVNDYFLSDVYLDPVGEHDEDFSEELIRLPHSHFCFNPLAAMRHPMPPYQPKDYVLFAGFNNFFKITDAMLAAWAEILREVPGSKLLLKNSMHRTGALKGIRKKAARAGIPKERLIIEDASGDYVYKYAEADIILDTYPYTGGATTCDALYRGLPVVSLSGSRHGTRFSYSLLQNTGLGELCAATVDEYVNIAVTLAKDKNRLQKLHDEIPGRFKASPVMNYKGYMQEIEAVYLKIWEKWLNGYGK